MAGSSDVLGRVRTARRRLLTESLGIAVSAGAFGFVFGLAAHDAGLSPLEAGAMSVIVFAGASQFAAVGYLAVGMPWLAIIVLTALLNARHLLYAASLAPRLRTVPPRQRAAMAHVLTDEAFALSAAHFHRLGRVDVPGYWMAAMVGVFIPWNLATLAGALLGGSIPDPSGLGLDIVFPAAMAGLAVGLITSRRELVAAGAGAASGVLLSLTFGPSLGIVAGGLLGPALAMLVPGDGPATPPDSEMAGIPVDVEEAASELAALEPEVDAASELAALEPEVDAADGDGSTSDTIGGSDAGRPTGARGIDP